MKKNTEKAARQQRVSQQTRKEYDALLLAMQRLEAALASAACGKADVWVVRVDNDLQSVHDLLVDHIRSTERPHGLLAELDLAWPTQDRKAQELQEEHAKLLDQATDLLALVHRSRQQGNTDFTDIRARCAQLLTAMRQHQAAETDLIFETFYTDIGVGD